MILTIPPELQDELDNIAASFHDRLEAAMMEYQTLRGDMQIEIDRAIQDYTIQNPMRVNYWAGTGAKIHLETGEFFPFEIKPPEEKENNETP